MGVSVVMGTSVGDISVSVDGAVVGVSAEVVSAIVTLLPSSETVIVILGIVGFRREYSGDVKRV